eukprot:4262743-Amphidinium_carterae.1
MTNSDTTRVVVRLSAHRVGHADLARGVATSSGVPGDVCLVPGCNQNDLLEYLEGQSLLDTNHQASQEVVTCCVASGRHQVRVTFASCMKNATSSMSGWSSERFVVGTMFVLVTLHSLCRHLGGLFTSSLQQRFEHAGGAAALWLAIRGPGAEGKSTVVWMPSYECCSQKCSYLPAKSYKST